MRNKPIFILSFLIFNFINYTPSFSSQNLREEEVFDEDFSFVIKRVSGFTFVSCDINDEHARKIAHEIKGLSHITTLNFNHNLIGNDGITALGEAFETMPNLTSIDLYGNRFDATGAANLFSSLNKINSLVHIDIRTLALNESLLHPVREVLEANPKLNLQLNFSGCKGLFK